MNYIIYFILSLISIYGCNSQKAYMVNSYEDFFPSSSNYSDEVVDKNYDNQEYNALRQGDNKVVNSSSDSEEYFEEEESNQENTVDTRKKKSICKAKVAPGPKKVGKPYVVGGVKYYPISSADGFSETGIASWYGPGFHGKLTANGEKYNQKAMTAAHKTLPLPTYVRVENLENGKEIIVRVNDRGPFSKGRIIDLTEEGARRIDMLKKGTAKVRISVLSEDENCFVSGGKEVDLNVGDFAIQIGAFSIKDNAYRLAERFKGKSQVSEGYSKGTLWYRVWITGFTTKKEAENAVLNYENEFTGAFVIAK